MICYREDDEQKWRYKEAKGVLQQAAGQEDGHGTSRRWRRRYGRLRSKSGVTATADRAFQGSDPGDIRVIPRYTATLN